MKLARFFLALFALFNLTVHAQTPSCNVPRALSALDISANSNVSEALRRLQCAANWSGRDQARSAGIADDVALFGVAAGAPFTSEAISTWKKANCTTSESSAAFAPALYQALVYTDPDAAKVAADCSQQELANEAHKALRCQVVDSPHALLFTATWRNPGNEGAAAAPKVKAFTALNTVCQNITDLAINKPISGDGTSLLCSNTDLPAAFFLTTSRGSCVAGATPRKTVIAGLNSTLQGATQIEAYKIKFPDNAKVITQGYPLLIRATEIEVGSNVQIVAFTQGATQIGQPGSSAGPVTITAETVRGSVLTILNAGQAGGPGSPGAKGGTGAPGAPGKTRLPKFQQNCPAWLPCGLIPAGCTGGEDGGQGGQGNTGGTGYPGAAGGNGGTVTLDVPYDMRSAFKVLTDITSEGVARSCGGICGGVGGPGGAGGDGGDGGPGGPGAPSAGHCGGTNGGPGGGKGATGQPGPSGGDGSRGSVIYR